MRGYLTRLRDRAHVRQLCTSKNKGQPFFLAGSIRYFVLSYISEPRWSPQRLWALLEAWRLRQEQSSLYVGGSLTVAFDGLYTDILPSACFPVFELYSSVFAINVGASSLRTLSLHSMMLLAFFFVFTVFSLISREEYIEFLDRFTIPLCYSPILPGPNQTVLDVPSGYSALYFLLFTSRNFHLPLNKFFVDV
ncbi:hypothetical protein Tco_0633322 [Tanacetum coccineum]